MKTNFLTSLACGLLAASSLIAQPDTSPVPAPLTLAPEKPDVATMRVDKAGKPSSVFLDAHESFLKRARERPIGLLFIGDSITAGWNSVGKEVWAKYYQAHNPANFGIGGDRTQHVLWRIENGELDGISPKVVVLLIGVNNGGKPAVFPGIKKIVEEIRVRLPASKILLLGVFPHGNDPLNPPWIPRARVAIVELNKLIAGLDDGRNVRYLDIGSRFLDPTGAISKGIMPDGLHPAAPGYQIWADAMQPLLQEMLGE
jgi:lysophospholipase L1-like esterase